MRRREINVFSLSFLDAMTCGFGAVVLFYMVINAAAGLRSGEMTADLRGEVDRLEDEVLEGYANLVEIRNRVGQVDDQLAAASGLSRRLIEQLEQIRAELALYSETTQASEEHINKLKTDLQTLEKSAKRLSAAATSEEAPVDRVREFIGDGTRQYLTGLKVGGSRIFILVDASASMLDETIVNVIRRRNLPDEVKLQADKWRQAVRTVDWLTTQIPRGSEFQIYTFNERAESVLPATSGEWLDAGNREVLDRAVAALGAVVPRDGTNLQRGLAAIGTMRPRPDNVILLVDGLPTQGEPPSRRATVTGSQRLRLFNRAVGEVGAGVPINVILFPMEGDPDAASAYWKLAVATRGSFMSPAEDWP
jgi:hypothetical protein